MKILILVFVIFLTGCSQTIDSWEIRKARLYCGKLGIDNISIFMYNTVRCVDGRKEYISKIEIEDVLTEDKK